MSTKPQITPPPPSLAALMSFVAESPLDALIVDREGRILQISQVAASATEEDREQLVGLSIEEAFGERAGSIRGMLAAGAFDIPGKLPRTQIQTPTGNAYWLETTYAPWRHDDGQIGGVTFVTQNVTAEHRALSELGRAETLLDAIVQSMPSMLAVREYETGSLVLLNGAAKTFLGPSRDHLIGGEPLAPEDKLRWRRDCAALEANTTLINEEMIPNARGELRTTVVHRRLIEDSNGHRHVLAVGEDITERKRAEEALQAALWEAEAANRAKSDFVATMSHEIRTPLNGVLGMAQAMARDELTAVQRQRLEVLHHSGEALLTILNDVLDLSKIEAGKLELEAADFDLRTVVEGSVAGFSALAADKGISMIVDIGDADGTYRGDRGRIRQAISNLVSNAVKFTDVGEVRVNARREDGCVILTVSDTGPGMPPEVLGRLFEKFMQADSSTTRKYGGTGLGLAICRELTELMGGKIRAESPRGRGAIFTLSLPLPWIGEAMAYTAIKPDLAEAEAGALRGLRILAAEDNLVNQKVLKVILEQFGLDVTLVSDGVEAVEACQALPWDIVLMDVQMPKMDGVEATRRIRQIERDRRLPRTPIVALTANAMEHQTADYLACGMDRIVAKPIQIAELVGAIEALVGRTDGAPMLAAAGV